MSNTALSQAPDRSNSLDLHPLHLSLHHVTIWVSDQDRSLRFYLDQLGFNLFIDIRNESGDRWVAVAPPDGIAILALVSPSPDSDEYKLIGRSRDIVFVTEDVPAKFHQWREGGLRFHHPPQATPWGGTFTRFEDPDGNCFVLMGRDEVSQDIDAQRRAVAEKLEAERRAAQELEIAKQVQARLFPQTLPKLQTLEYAGICVQAREVGGDYYDFLNLGRERLGFVIGDTSGKGIGAALLMANLQANLRSQSVIASDQPQRFLQSVNQLFYENTTDSAYATLVFVEYDDASGRVRYANCGHYPGLLFRSDRTLERLDSTSTVLGLFAEWDCLLNENQLFPGDTLALYTDGVTDSFNEAGEDFGEQRLIEAMWKHSTLSPQRMIAAIVDEIQQFSPHEQHDDITMIVAKCREG